MPKKRQDKTPSAARKTTTGKESSADYKRTDAGSEPSGYVSKNRQAGAKRDLSADSATGDGAEGGIIRRVASRVRGLFSRKVVSKITGAMDHEVPVETVKESPKQVRVTRRETDIPMDRLDNAYTPMQTSLKGGFRDDGADRHSSQEFANGVDDSGWNDEDHYTNKSEDPRIGTRGRTYEPGEARNESRE